MLEWLKNILGDGYTDEVDAKVSAEIGKNFVSKADFNQVNAAKKKAEDDVKTRDQQLETLKKSTGDTAALQEQITTLQTQNAEAKRPMRQSLPVYALMAPLRLPSPLPVQRTTPP